MGVCVAVAVAVAVTVDAGAVAADGTTLGSSTGGVKPAATQASTLTFHLLSFVLPSLKATSLILASIPAFVETVSKCCRSWDTRSVWILLFP